MVNLNYKFGHGSIENLECGPMLPHGMTLPRGPSVLANGTMNEQNGVMGQRKFLSLVCGANPPSDDEM
jgi:hypothetical protein